MATDGPSHAGRDVVLVSSAPTSAPDRDRSAAAATAALVEMENGKLAVRLFRAGDTCSPVVDLDLSGLARALTER